MDPGRIGLPPPQCECGVLPLNYGPKMPCRGAESRTRTKSSQKTRATITLRPALQYFTLIWIEFQLILWYFIYC